MMKERASGAEAAPCGCVWRVGWRSEICGWVREYGGLSTAAAKAPPSVEMTWWRDVGICARYGKAEADSFPFGFALGTEWKC